MGLIIDLQVNMLHPALSSWTLALTGITHYIAVGIAPPPLPKEERVKGIDIVPFSEWARISSNIYQLILSGMLAGEAVSVLVRNGVLSRENRISNVLSICPPSYRSDSQTQLPILAWVGCLISISGSLFRIWGQRSLGPRLFTWEVSIRPGHTLYTKGPYSLVRHPGYAGTLTLLTGEIIFLVAEKTFVKECIRSTFPLTLRICYAFMGVWMGIIGFSTLNRVKTEDELLKKKFGSEWEEWAGRTKYRIIPGVF